MAEYADANDYTWPLADNERLSELVGNGGALYDVPPVKAKDATNTVFVPVVEFDDVPLGLQIESDYDTRTCNDRHTAEMGRLWEAFVHLQRRVEALEQFNKPGK